MIFKSPTHPGAESPQELIVLCYGEARVLVPLPETYENAIEIAKEELGLEGEAHLITHDIPGLTGQKVKIHATAWKGIAPILVSVTVESVVRSPRASHVPRQSFLRPTTPARVVVHEEGAAPAPELLSSAQNRRVSRKSLGLRNTASKSSASASRGSPCMPASVGRADSDGSFVTTIGDEDEDEDEEVDEIEDDLLIPSSSKKGTRRRVYSDDEGDEPDSAQVKETRAEVQASSHDLSHDGPNNSHISPKPELDKVSTVDEGRDTASTLKTTPEPERGPSSRPSKDSSMLSSRGSGSHDRLGLPQNDNSNGSESLAIKAERVREDYTAAPSLSNSQAEVVTSQPHGEDSDDRFVVTIEFDDGIDAEANQTGFKTRGRHLVSKVLMQACRTFGIQHLCDRAYLVLIVEVEDEDEIIEHRFSCSPGDTMAKAGAKPDSRFAIEIEGQE